jgi:hypothetical protein
MSFNDFMLPALPQTPNPSLSCTDSKGPALFKSNRLTETTDQESSFSTTLDRISGQHYGSNPKATRAEKAAVTSSASDAESANPEKMSKTAAPPKDDIEENEAPVLPVTGEASPFVHALQAFGLMHDQLMNVSTADEGSLAMEPPSDSSTASSFFTLTDLIGYLQTKAQQIRSDQMSIGAFEQLQANISLEAANLYFFDQLAAGTNGNSDAGGAIVPEAQFLKFWQSMTTQPALQEALIGQGEFLGANMNAPFNLLLHMPENTAIVSGSHPVAAGADGQNPPANLETIKLNADFLLKMLASFQAGEYDLSESSKMAVAGKEGRLSPLMPGDSNSQILPEILIRPLNENPQQLKIEAALKVAAEQPANPNSAAEGITAKEPEDVFGIKSAALKNEILPVPGIGNKITHIDGDGKDSGLLFSQDQVPQHMARLENAAQPSEAAQRSLMSQTLNQVVQKAVLSLNNGYNEVQIDLKPEFLGHIRMQIVTENHQVAIKIVTEFPFVKNMLESNMNQLKAELQAQGLEIGELDVSVAHDSHMEGNAHQTAEATKLHIMKNSADFDDAAPEKPSQLQSRGGGAMAQTAIDYFA